MRVAALLTVAICATAGPCLAEGRHLSCPAQISETVGGTTRIFTDTLQLYLDQTGKKIVFEASPLRGGNLFFKTTAFSDKLVSADVADRTTFGSYFDAPAESGFLRFDRTKGAGSGHVSVAKRHRDRNRQQRRDVKQSG